MGSLFKSPLFTLGLLCRILLIFIISPAAVTEWYAPFLEVTTTTWTIDPWNSWLSNGGSALAFPYGHVMWLIFAPATYVFNVVSLPIQYAYQFTLLLVDFFLLLVMFRLLPNHKRLVLAGYWLSPIIILATYGLGFNDIVPIFFVMSAILYIKLSQLKLAGLACAAALSAKLSMILAIPLCLIYIYNNKTLRKNLLEFVLVFIGASVTLAIPLMKSSGGLEMVFGHPEMEKIYILSLQLNEAISIYIIPVVYIAMLYFVWRMRRTNFDLFMATTGITFLSLALMTPTSPGWFVWAIPLLVLYLRQGGDLAKVLLATFSLLWTINTLILFPLNDVFSFDKDFDSALNVSYYSPHLKSLFYTSMVAVGLVLVARMWREAINNNEFYRLSRKPFVIGIAGDSGAGKDIFAEALRGLFGMHSVVGLSGDNYHLWDRQKPMWKVMTHLNPMANDLEKFSNDLVSLVDGKAVSLREYEHEAGQMGKVLNVKSNDFIIASGLHALYLPILRDCYDLKIYLKMDEGLRRYFKVRRDTEKRGYSVEKVLKAFDDRATDSVRFIRPQMEHADLIMSLEPIHPRLIENFSNDVPPRLKLSVVTRQGFNELSLKRVLIGVCGLHVDILSDPALGEVVIVIEGETSAADIAIAAEILCPKIFQFLDTPPKWEHGPSGLMQLIALSHINQSLTKRFI